MESTERKDIVKYDNKFMLTDINTFSVTEQDIFFTIISAFTENQKQEEKFSLKLIREKAKMSFEDSSQGEAKFRRALVSASEKILKILFTGVQGDEVILITLFKLFKIDFKKGTLHAVLNDVFAHYFYDVPESFAFSWFELEAFLQMRSKYTKTFFRKLRQNFTGVWSVEFDEFRKIMGFPKTWTASQILRLIQEKVIPEIEKTGTYKDFHIEKTYSTARGRALARVVFTYTCLMDSKSTSAVPGFDPVLVKKTIEHQEIQPNFATGQPEVTTTTKVVEEPEKCPRCGADVIRRKDKEGKSFRCCMNSNYWNLGNKSCSWMEYDE